MRKRRKTGDNVTPARMLSITDAASYLGLGENSARKLCERAGALRHIGKRTLADRKILDEFLDTLADTKKETL